MLSTIKAKLLAVLLGLAAALLATGAAGLISLRLDDDALLTIYRDRVMPLKELKSVSDMYAVNVVDTTHKIRNGGMTWDDGLRSLDDATAELNRQWTAYLGRQLTSDEERLAAETRALMRVADGSVTKLKSLVAARDSVGLNAYVIDELYPSIDPVTQKIGELVDLQLRSASERFADALRAGEILRVIQWMLTAFALFAVGFCVWVVMRQVIRPLAAITDVMARLARSDLTASVPGITRNDEIGRMAHAVDVFRSSMIKSNELQELTQRHHVLQQIIDAIPQAIAVLDAQHMVRFANGSLRDLLGIGATSEPWSLDKFSAGMLLRREVFEDLLRGGPHEIEIESSDRKPLRVKTTPLATGVALVTIFDLSAQRRAEIERLEQQQRLLLAEKSQAIATLASSIAHDFNNLLAVILGFSSIAFMASKALLESQKLTTNDANELEEIASSISKVITGAERGRNIVASLNSLSKEKRQDTEQLDLREVVKDSEQLLLVLFPASVQLDLQLPDLACKVLANRTQIEQIVTNLCINAVHALEHRAGRVTVGLDTVNVGGTCAQALRATGVAAQRHGSHVRVGADGTIEVFVGLLAKGPHLRLQVLDNGHGMTEAVAREMFKPFFTTKGGGGTGLGLSSVLELVDSLQGGIHVRTKPKTGTTFMIFLSAPGEIKVLSAGEQSSIAGDRTTLHEASIRTETRIVVIDDEPLMVDLAAKVLRQAGYEVDAFGDPLLALQRLIAAPDSVDLIITDQTMPQMTGLEFVENACAHGIAIPVIICTGHAADVERDGSLPAGVKAILRKPYAPPALVEAVRTALAA